MQENWRVRKYIHSSVLDKIVNFQHVPKGQFTK